MTLNDLCLGSLCLSDASGYDIKKLFEAAFSHFHGASFGSIYPALKSLAEQGLIEEQPQRKQGRPDRKLYRVTPSGKATFSERLSQAEPSEQMRSDFLVILFFAHLLPNARLREVLDQMTLRCQQKLAYLREIRDQPEHSSGIRLTIDLGIACTQARLDTLVSHREELLATHREPPQCNPN